MWFGFYYIFIFYIIFFFFLVLSFDSCFFFNHSHYCYQGGIYFYFFFLQPNFLWKSHQPTGVLYVSFSNSYCFITNSTFKQITANLGSAIGGIMFLYPGNNSVFTIDRCVLSESIGSNLGAIYLYFSPYIRIARTRFEKNEEENANDIFSNRIPCLNNVEAGSIDSLTCSTSSSPRVNCDTLGDCNEKIVIYFFFLLFFFFFF
jgi:hypothetical protein